MKKREAGRRKRVRSSPALDREDADSGPNPGPSAANEVVPGSKDFHVAQNSSSTSAASTGNSAATAATAATALVVADSVDILGIDFPAGNICPLGCRVSFTAYREYQVNEHGKCHTNCWVQRKKLDQLGQLVEKACYPSEVCWRRLEDSVLLRNLDKPWTSEMKSEIVGGELMVPGATGEVDLGKPCEQSSECKSTCCATILSVRGDDTTSQVCQVLHNLKLGAPCQENCQCKSNICRPDGTASKQRNCMSFLNPLIPKESAANVTADNTGKGEETGGAATAGDGDGPGVESSGPSGDESSAKGSGSAEGSDSAANEQLSPERVREHGDLKLDASPPPKDAGDSTEN